MIFSYRERLSGIVISVRSATGGERRVDMAYLKRLLANRSGVVMVEYALIVSLIGIATVVDWLFLGIDILDLIDYIGSLMD